MRAALSLFLVVALSSSSTTSAVKAPESWAVIGYEKFKDPPADRRRAPAARESFSSKKGVGETKEKAPSSLSKAILGIGAAVAVAAIGGGLLGGEVKPELALVEAIKKPIVIVKKEVPPVVTTSQEGASIPNEVFNLVKAIVGVGVLSLPAGVAAFGSAPSAFIPAGILITIIGILSGYGFALIGRVCAYTGARSYREAWSRTVGENTSWIPAWSATCKTFMACLAYSMVLADTFSSLLETSRNGTLLSVTLLVLTPLCLMKDLKSLAPFSLLGVMGMAYTAFAMTVRWLDGSYSMNGDQIGSLAAEVAHHLRPKFGNLGVASVWSPNSLILICMLSTAYMAHFNAPKFYLELKNNTIKRYNSVVSWSFGISIFLMGFISMVGFLTFGKSCHGLVLNNYAPSDVWMGFSRVAVAVSLVFSYPLAFTGFRDGFLDLAQISMEKRTSGMINLITIALLGSITFLACTLTDVSFVLAFGGATLGNALTYVYPAIMYRTVVRQQNRKGEGLGVAVATGSAVLGTIMGVIGAAMALKSLE